MKSLDEVPICLLPYNRLMVYIDEIVQNYDSRTELTVQIPKSGIKPPTSAAHDIGICLTRANIAKSSSILFSSSAKIIVC